MKVYAHDPRTGELLGEYEARELCRIDRVADHWRSQDAAVTVTDEQDSVEYVVRAQCDDRPDCTQSGEYRTDDLDKANRQAQRWQDRGYRVTIDGVSASDPGREVFDDYGNSIGRMMPASNARQKPKNAAMALMLDRIYARSNTEE